MTTVANDLQERLKTAVSTEIKPSFANIKVEPKKEEENEVRFPRNLHNACELFVMTNQHGSALRCSSSINKYLDLLAANPDGTSKNNIGRACICWVCGHLGIPANANEMPESGYSNIMPKCKQCNSSEQTNFIKIPRNGKNRWFSVPWCDGEGEHDVGFILDRKRRYWTHTLLP
eukprot:g9845.t1